MSDRLEGIHYVCDGWTKTNGRRRRKPTLAELKRSREVCENAQRESDRIRKAAGLEPIPPNFYREALAVELAKREAVSAKPAKRKRSLSIPAVLRAELDALGSEYGFKVVPA